MTPGKAITVIFSIYNLIWAILIPFLKRKPRIADGFDERMGRHLPTGPVDIWIQSASAGESYLTAEILSQFDPSLTFSLWLTTNTRQGLDILLAERKKRKQTHPKLSIHISFSPFDQPSLMDRVVRKVKPQLMVLVELEVWPGLLKALKENTCKILVVNGRLTEKSMKRYLLMPSLWAYLSPDAVCAISDDDAGRFSRLFPSCSVKVLPNIKFDRFAITIHGEADNPLSDLLGTHRPIVTLGSIRQEEETQVTQIIRTLIDDHPHVLVLLFPRHMHRITFWVDRLNELGISFIKRSDLPGMNDACRVVVWDCFGELGYAYDLAQAAFVGGSLAPLGGQNFLEVLACGLVPVTGPSWDNFAWVGQDIVDKGLLIIEPTANHVARRLLNQIQASEAKEAVRHMALDYLERKKGGTRLTCERILSLINPLARQGHR